MSDMLETENRRMNTLRPQIKTHHSLLTQIANNLNLKYSEAFDDTQRRFKRGLINGLGSIFKIITCTLDASDGQYCTDCINKIIRDENELQNLMKNQISVTTSVIKNFNQTIQKLQIEEATFNQDLNEIQNTLYDLSNELNIYEEQYKLLEFCEMLTESYTFLQDELNDFLKAITFARLKFIHTSIITPKDFITALHELSQSLVKYNLPLPVSHSTIASFYISQNW